jgi:hypothetical protein
MRIGRAGIGDNKDPGCADYFRLSAKDRLAVVDL